MGGRRQLANSLTVNKGITKVLQSVTSVSEAWHNSQKSKNSPGHTQEDQNTREITGKWNA